MVKAATTALFVQRPCAPLRPLIKRFLVVEATAAHRDHHLPETGFIAAFRFRGQCRLGDGRPAPTMALTGLGDRLRTHVHTHDYGAVIVHFTATGAATLLRQSAHQFTNTTTDLTALLGTATAVDRFYAQLAAAATPEARIQQVATFLLAQLHARDGDPEVAQAVALLEQAETGIRIAQLAQQVGLSQSALERRFRRQVGIAPRKYASLVRLRRVVRLRAMGADFTTIAHAAGYLDQAHFIKDFRNYVGLAPSTFFAAPATEAIDERHYFG